MENITFEIELLCTELTALEDYFIDFSSDFNRFGDKDNYELLNGQSLIISHTIIRIRDELHSLLAVKEPNISA